MLSVSNIRRSELEIAISQINKISPPKKHVKLALVNTDSRFVVSGSQRCLGALIRFLGSQSPKGPSSQVRIPHSQRKPSPSMRFLPISIPCHCGLLDEAISMIEDDLQGISLLAGSLKVLVNVSVGGYSLNTSTPPEGDLVPVLIRMIITEPVYWPRCDFDGATEIVDFGPGASRGIGVLTNHNVVGSGARIIMVGMLAGNEESNMGSLVELFSKDVVPGSRWADEHRVSVVRTTSGLVVASKLSRLLGLPPFFVAGMTPTTTHPEFVAAISTYLPQSTLLPCISDPILYSESRISRRVRGWWIP